MGITRTTLHKNEALPSGSSPHHPLLDYFLLVFVLSIPFWLIGGRKLPLPINLPASALMWVNPALAASILRYRRSGPDGVKGLLKKALDYREIRKHTWYLPILALVPSVYVSSYLMMRWAGLPLPKTIEFPVYEAPLFFLIFLIPAAGEELGWSGYAIEPMQNRWGALRASLMLGLIWQLWHIIPDVQAGNSASWIVWDSLYSVALRIVIVWNYNNTGKSVFAATLVHTMDNVSWALFPNHGSHLDPAVTAIVAWIIATGIIVKWGPKTLTRQNGS